MWWKQMCVPWTKFRKNLTQSMAMTKIMQSETKACQTWPPSEIWERESMLLLMMMMMTQIRDPSDPARFGLIIKIACSLAFFLSYTPESSKHIVYTSLRGRNKSCTHNFSNQQRPWPWLADLVRSNPHGLTLLQIFPRRWRSLIGSMKSSVDLAN